MTKTFIALYACLLGGCENLAEEEDSVELALITDWYVSPTGTSTNTGTQSSPWSLAYAASCAGGRIHPGDRVNLLGGVYAGGVSITCSGTSAAPLTYRAAPGSTRPILEGAIAAFAQVNNGAWERYVTVPGQNVYRSRNTYTFPNNYHFTGFINVGGAWLSLLVHGHNAASGGDALAYLTSEIDMYRRPDAVGIAALQNVATNANATINGTHATQGIATLPEASFVGGSWTPAAVVTVVGTDASGAALTETSAMAITTFDSTKRFKTVTRVSFSAAVQGMTFGTTRIPRYVGPGLAYNVADSRIYIRLDNPSAASQRGRAVATIANPDPNALDLRIAPITSVGVRVIGSYVVVDGLEIDHFAHGISTVSSAGPVTAVTFRNLDVTPGYFGGRLGFADNIRIEQSRFHARMPAGKLTAASVDIKGGDEPVTNTRKLGIDLNAAHHVTVLDNEIDEFYDAILGSNSAHTVTVRGNVLRQTWDDGWQLYYGNHHVEIGYNQFLGAGVSRDGSGSQASIAPNQGTVWIHHNVFAPNQHQIWWYRGGMSLPVNVDADGVVDGIPLSSHGSPSGTDYSFPWKLYYNTFIVREPKDNAVGIGAIGHLGNLASNYDGAPHEVYNNIFVDDEGITPNPTYWRSAIGITKVGREMYDGNVFSGWTTRPLYRYVRLSNDVDVPNIYSVEALRANATILTETRAYPIPSFQGTLRDGWERRGFTSPAITFNGCFQPTSCFASPDPNKSCATNAVSLVGSGWPGTAVYEPWRGAMSPSTACAIK